ncbi:M48 family metalloprotease [Hymenobacter sp. NST-14]|uniref:M56 family metallopeptidase n=1 Tax=Hymenobacter piscis TaxID=2839984 RepID=UPI001C02DD7D|nr:M56 family metallopeptidase [Hymenobacter piscis]MBT9391681.1 M48 family metalloprotease [Hymenobacter piscis]
MNWLTQLLPPALIRALGWALVHSLWQGALLALLLAGLLLVLRQHAAQVRYRTAAAALLTLLLLIGITFGRYYYQPPAAPATSAGLTTYQPVDAPAAAPGPEASWAADPAGSTTAPVSWAQTWQQYFDANLPLVVTVWMMGLLVMLLRLLGGLAYVQRLRRYRVQPLAEEWQQRLAALARRAGLQQKVELLESALVKVPVVVGHLRPVVLLPLGTVTGLGTAYLEAILAHELAHVQRRDYLLNLLQSVAETVLFYHPGVWFITACLRTERENCCDDAATALIGGNPLTVARALAALAELNAAPEPTGVGLALSALGPDGSVLGRIRRLVQGRQRPTFAEGFMAACVVLVGLVVLSTAVALARPQVLALEARVRHLEATAESWPSVTEYAAPATVPATAPVTAPAGLPLTDEVVPTAWDREPLCILSVSADGQAQGRIGNTPVSFDTSRAPQLMRWSRAGRRGRTGGAAEQGTVIIKRDKKGRLTELYVNGEPIAIAPARKKGEQVDVVQLNGATGRALAVAPLAATTDREQRMEELALRMQQSTLSGSHPSAADARELSSLALAEASTALQELDVNRITREALQEAELDLRTAAKNAKTDEEREQIQEALEDLRERQQELRENQQERRQQLREEAQERQRDIQQDIREAQEQARRDAEQARRDAEQAVRDQEQARRDADQVRRDQEQAHRDAGTALLLRELRQDGIIKTTGNLQFVLSATSLNVNGTRQPAAVQQKYLRLVEKHQGKPLKGIYNLNYQTSSSTTTNLNGPAVPRPPRAPGVPPVAAPAPPMPPRLDSEELRQQLRRDGVLGARDKAFQFQLNEQGLTVNGKKQSAALAEKYRRLLAAPTDGNGQSQRNIQISVTE